MGRPGADLPQRLAGGSLIKVAATDTSITVRFYSSELGRRVETETGEPYAYVEPAVRTVTNPSLPPGTRTVVQDPGAAGFTIDYTRRVYRDGELRRDERHRWRYDAKDRSSKSGRRHAAASEPAKIRACSRSPSQ